MRLRQAIRKSILIVALLSVSLPVIFSQVVAAAPAGSDDSSAVCYDNSGALGWVVCPVINIGAPAIKKLVENFIEPFLQIDVRIFVDDSDNLVNAWSQFQTIANIAFVAIFIVVIFSQLTGVGIGNYGIKKILPKLIIAAILINASYIICQLAVEVSNIVGLGIKNIFMGIADNVDAVSVSNLESGTTEIAIDKTLSFGLIIAIVGALSVAAFMSSGPIGILLTLIVIGASVLMLFVLLSIRQALAVLLVVVSPIAFASYMLDGTKKAVFDKWFQLFKAMLIAYPIISLIIYGGQAVARILIGVNIGTGSSMGFILGAAIACVAPIFFIPSLIVKSFGSLSGLVETARRRLTPSRAGMEKDIKEGRGIGKIGAVRTLSDTQRAVEKARSARRAEKRYDKIKEGGTSRIRRGASNWAASGGIRGRVGGAVLKGYDQQARVLKREANAAFDDDVETEKITYFSGLSDSAIADDFEKLIPGGSGSEAKFNRAHVIAGLDSIFKEEDFMRAYIAASQNKDFQEALKNPEFRKSINSMLAKRGPTGVAIAKTNEKIATGSQTIGEGENQKAVESFSFANADFREAYEKNLGGVENSSFNNVSKDTFARYMINGESYGLMDGATATQIAHIAESGLTGGTSKEYIEYVEGSAKREEAARNLTPEGVISLTPAQAFAYGGHADAVKAGEAFEASGGDLNKAAEILARSEGGSQDVAAEYQKLQAAVVSFQNNTTGAREEALSPSTDRSRMNPLMNTFLGRATPTGNSAANATGGAAGNATSNSPELVIDHGQGQRPGPENYSSSR